MSELKKRKVVTPEFKAKVGLEAVRGVKTLNEIGQEFGVHPAQVGQWKKAILEQAKTLFEGKRGPMPATVLRRRCIPNSDFSKLESELEELKSEVLNTPTAMRRSRISQKSDVSISRQCVLAGVSRATVYAQQKRRREELLRATQKTKDIDLA
jgi:transposase-like protein